MSNKTITIVVLIAVVLVGAYVIYGQNTNIDTTPSVNVKETKKVEMGKILGAVQSDEVKYLTDNIGITLYTFTDDKKLESTCNNACLENWIPYEWDTRQEFKTMTSPLDKKINAVKRSDGTYQYAYGDQPLYYYAGDKVLGDTKGNGLDEGKWKIVLITE